jgi:hypothetical protein
MRFISTKEIQVGDTIVWKTSHHRYHICYMTIEDIEEGETNFRGYDSNGMPVFDGDPWAVLFVSGKVMGRDGERTDYKPHMKYHLNVGDNIEPIILVSRKGEQQ